MGQFLNAARTLRRKSLAGAVVSAALLLPVPAFAITFLGSWSFSQSQSSGVSAATTSSTDTATGGALTINMGKINNKKNASSSITATRQFTATAGQNLVVDREFITSLTNAGLSVSLTVKDASNATVYSYSLNQPVPTTGSITDPGAGYTALAGGTYSVSITITHTTGSTSGNWDNTASAYTFSFNGQ